MEYNNLLSLCHMQLVTTIKDTDLQRYRHLFLLLGMLQEVVSYESLPDSDAFDIDPTGDFFGDYDNYSLEEFGLESTKEMDDIRTHKDNETDSDEEDIDSQPEQTQLEPERVSPNREASEQIGQDESCTMDTESEGAFRMRGGAEAELGNKPHIIRFNKGNSAAGRTYPNTNCIDANTLYTAQINDTGNSYSPFRSKIEWEIALWAKMRGPSSTAFTELINIEGVAERLGLSFKNSLELNKLIDQSLPGRPHFEHHEILVGNEVCDVYFRDITACIKALFGDPSFAPYLMILPEKHYTDERRTKRMYHDMNTGRWWWLTQEELEKDKPGATILPVIISTDKTQLTTFKNKTAYPLYLTLGNIPKEIRRKPSNRAYILLAYLPTTKLENVPNKSARRRQLANLYHACLGRILEPLRAAGVSGIHMATGNGSVHRNHPILACFSGDYPEQVLVTCTKTGECPTCDAPRDELGMYDLDQNPKLRDLGEILKVLDSFDNDPGGFLQACSEAGIKPVVEPFWKELPYVHIYRSITPDILHQLYQGIIKHLIAWITQALGALEIDARCRRMPPNHNIRHFTKGITCLSRVTGQEHDQMSRILMGLILDAPLPNGLSNVRLVRSVRALLDFLYLAKYPIHTDETLQFLEDSLQRFHANKEIFVDLGIRKAFDIPKLHFARHYVEYIKLYGTLDNFNTEHTERLHIDLAKDAYAATNRKDEFRQMTVWLERKEKMIRHQQYVKWKLEDPPITTSCLEWTPPGLDLNRTLKLTKHPTARSISIDNLVSRYGATHFRTALERFVALTNEPNLTRAQLERKLWGIRIPFTKLPVWHRIKFTRQDPSSGEVLPARFDPALINDGTGKDVGLEGYHIGRIHVVFSLPRQSLPIMFTSGREVPEHLAYVEWYTPLPNSPEPGHLLYKVSPKRDRDGTHVCSIIPVANIRRSVHLYPKFGVFAPQEWTLNNVLDLCHTFFVNDFTDLNMYRIAC
ncbi:hypothetical protein HYPSUDRAFT_1096163 [Hypholoma sublateritium FD-334 SS-4]|uniref:CxC2-like cysteine cluster KDZ transposase-associated domain-containing protein n=1 Tax=Hypholoma sublateritium (strain FD-334 SS-4) TaxID=945553 RepID=A0A0D2NRL7_HYPSF|nr:hypothetical protein HYPSUDRAFT_1096163 [Hypholoma sublateritium FD-334 SS-4]